MEKEVKNKIGSSQIYELITGRELSWQDIIYDLIKTEQLDPWNIDVGILADKYLAVIEKMEEANFNVSSKVLLACSLLLRLKSDFFSEKYLQEMEELIYGKKEEKKSVETIQFDEDEWPILVPRTPLPRYKRVTLQELIASLNKAVETENRRIRREISVKQAEKSSLLVLPRTDRIPLRDRIASIMEKIKTHINISGDGRITFSTIAPTKKEKISAFLPVLHLSNYEKVYLRQQKHFGEIFIHLQQTQEEIEEIKNDLEAIARKDDDTEELGELEEFEEEIKKSIIEKKVKEIDKELENAD